MPVFQHLIFSESLTLGQEDDYDPTIFLIFE